VANHIIKRGSRYLYVRRIPSDLQDRFPSPILSRSLKTSDKKNANLLATSYDYQSERLFTRLRTAMLDSVTEKLLITLFLKEELDVLESIAKGQAVSKEAADTTEQFESIIVERERRKGETFTEEEKQTLRATIAERMAENERETLISKNTWMHDKWMQQLASSLKRQHGINITPEQQKKLALERINISKKANEARAALHRGEWKLFEALRDKVDEELTKPYFLFENVLSKYQEHYKESKPTIKAGTMADMEVECRVLLDIIGNRSIADVNTLDTLTKLQSILRRYPLNKIQRYGDRSIHSILKSEKGYAVISLKTANEYLKRLKAVIDYANRAKMINAANVVIGGNFQTETAEEDQRLAYDSEDISRLMDAICTQHLWSYGSPKPERFWIVLIALLHGLRLGNIVGLTKRDIIQTDRGTWVFMLRQGKTKATVRPVAICDCLLLLGFLEWAENSPREKLFQDSVDSFSKWYNRDETRKDGYTIQGFESRHVTTDKKKCLYSLRHAYAGNVFDVTGDYKITADLMGHSTGRSITSRYTKRTKAETLKQVSEQMDIQQLDLDQLEARAIELFKHM
jgi:integrase